VHTKNPLPKPAQIFPILLLLKAALSKRIRQNLPSQHREHHNLDWTSQLPQNFKAGHPGKPFNWFLSLKLPRRIIYGLPSPKVTFDLSCMHSLSSHHSKAAKRKVK
jgi:hypothetical protein